MHMQRSIQIDINDFFPKIDICLQEGDNFVPACVIDENIDGPALFDLGNSGIDGGAVSDIDGVGGGFAAGFFNHCRRFAAPGFIHVENGNLGAFFGETAGNFPPDSAAASGYNDAFSAQSSHAALLFHCSYHLFV